jgi:hypothetical protein
MISHADHEINTDKLISLFLDKAIDRGCVVPITVCQNGMVFRAYRHGEDVEFGAAEERMCVLMLDALAKSANREKLPHTWVEKALVLLIRIGIEQQFFNIWGGKLGDMQSLGIRFSLHGAITATGSEKIYHTSASNGLTDILEQHGYISRAKRNDPWEILKLPTSGFHADRANRAKLVGSVIGKILGEENKDAGSSLSLDELTASKNCLLVSCLFMHTFRITSFSASTPIPISSSTPLS